MYYYWGCTSIYWPLSYPFTSLNSINRGRKGGGTMANILLLYIAMNHESVQITQDYKY